jgi:hypothetical protein
MRWSGGCGPADTIAAAAITYPGWANVLESRAQSNWWPGIRATTEQLRKIKVVWIGRGASVTGTAATGVTATLTVNM